MSWTKQEFGENTPLWFRNQIRHRKMFSKIDYVPGKEVMCYWDGARYQVSTYNGHGASGTGQETMDINHGIKPATLRKLGGSDVGGPFYSNKFYVSPPSYGPTMKQFGENRGWGSRWYELTGPFWPSAETFDEAKRLWSMQSSYSPSPTFATASPSVWELNALGASAITRALPTLPDSDLAVSIAELREGLPSIVGRKLLKDPSLASVGDEFLNFTFGIEPIVADVVQLQKTSQDMVKKIDQLKRDSGRLVRRRFEISKNETKTTQVFPNRSSYPAEWAGTLTRDKTVTQRIWFSGAFKHSYPSNLDEMRQKIADFDAAYGIIPNASVAWNLQPYSWLVDWFSNVGDVMTNVSALGKNGLHIAYAYIMCETTVRIDDKLVGRYDPQGTGGWPIETSCSVVTTTKQRLKANPFGFGVSPTSLTAKQGAILTALGLSRSRM
jgi:hypothetical protein